MSFAVLDVNHNNCQQQEKVKNNSPEPVKILFHLKMFLAGKLERFPYRTLYFIMHIVLWENKTMAQTRDFFRVWCFVLD